MIASPTPSSNDIPAEIESKPAKFRFTKETAAEYGRRGAATTNGMKAIAAEVPPSGEPDQLDAFTVRRLLRVRKQLNLVDDEVERLLLSDDDKDQAKVKMLVESSSRLSEQERFLANRPGPGTRKPQPQRKSRGPAIGVCAEDSD